LENKRYLLEHSDFAQIGDAIAGIRKKAFEAGFDDYILNQIRMEALFAKIKAYLG
jgi:CheY-like chemotaxis protein